jgi:CheY-like chemotaxis protein
MPTTKVKSIFLAEDDEDDVVIFNEIMSDLAKNITVTVAVNGMELMNLLQKITILPELIFLDLNMPLKNGFECLQEIKSNNDWKEIKIVVYSTSAQPQQVDKAYKGGADLYLQKSTSYTDFKQAVENCLNTEIPISNNFFSK